MSWDGIKNSLRPNSSAKAKAQDRDVQTKTFNDEHNYSPKNEKPLEPKFAMNDTGKQVKTPGQFANGSNPSKMNAMKVPGATSAGIGAEAEHEAVQREQDQNDVDVIIKLSALRKLKEQAQQRPDTRKASSPSRNIDDLQPQR